MFVSSLTSCCASRWLQASDGGTSSTVWSLLPSNGTQCWKVFGLVMCLSVAHSHRKHLNNVLRHFVLRPPSPSVSGVKCTVNANTQFCILNISISLFYFEIYMHLFFMCILYIECFYLFTDTFLILCLFIYLLFNLYISLFCKCFFPVS